MLMNCHGPTVGVRVFGQFNQLHLRGSPSMMIGATECHGHGCGTLRGNRQHQQPDQQRSNKQPHGATLPQRLPRRWQTVFL